MLQLRVFGASPTVAEAARRLEAPGGSRHVLRTEDADSGTALVTADLAPDAADRALEAVRALGVPAEDVELLRLDSIGPVSGRRTAPSVVWADLLSLALETRASSSVGVAISVTTIPAAAYLGVAAGMREAPQAAGALLVLGINVAMLTVGGTATLLVQRALARHEPRVAGARPANHAERTPVRRRSRTSV